MQWYWWLMELSADIVEALMMVVFIQEFSEIKYKSRWPFILSTAIAFAAIVANNALAMPMAVNIAFYVGIGIAVGFLAYKGSTISRILLPLIVMAVDSMLDLLSFGLLLIVFNVKSSVLFSETSYRMLAVIISKVLLIMAVFFAGRFSKKSNYKIPLSYSLSLLMVPVISIVSMMSISQSVLPLTDVKLNPVWFAGTAIGLMFLNLLLIYLFQAMTKYSQDQNRLQLMVQQSDMLNRHLRETNALQEETQRIWHDMKNHFTVIQWMVNSRNYEKLEQYMQTLNETVAASMPLYQSGNHILDALLNSKAVEAKSNGIELIVNAAIPAKLPVEDMDLNIVFSNALDNAIEACKKLPGGKERYIELNTSMKNDHLVMTVKNPFTGNIRKTGDVLQSTKEEAGRHGIGIGNMKRAVEKYDGHILSDYNHGIFTLTAIMYCKI